MTTNAEAINHATILQDAESKTGHERTMGIVDAWHCWLETLGKGCEEMQAKEQQAIGEGKHAEFIATAGSPLPLDFHTDGPRILDLLAKEALSRKISPAPFLRAKQYVACEVVLSAEQCGLPMEEQHQEAVRIMGNCRSELEAAIMVLEEPPGAAAGPDEPTIKALTPIQKLIVKILLSCNDVEGLTADAITSILAKRHGEIMSDSVLVQRHFPSLERKGVAIKAPEKNAGYMIIDPKVKAYLRKQFQAEPPTVK